MQDLIDLFFNYDEEKLKKELDMIHNEDRFSDFRKENKDLIDLLDEMVSEESEK